MVPAVLLVLWARVTVQHVAMLLEYRITMIVGRMPVLSNVQLACMAVLGIILVILVVSNVHNAMGLALMHVPNVKPIVLVSTSIKSMALILVWIPAIMEHTQIQQHFHVESATSSVLLVRPQPVTVYHVAVCLVSHCFCRMEPV